MLSTETRTTSSVPKGGPPRALAALFAIGLAVVAVVGILHDFQRSMPESRQANVMFSITGTGNWTTDDNGKTCRGTGRFSRFREGLAFTVFLGATQDSTGALTGGSEVGSGVLDYTDPATDGCIIAGGAIGLPPVGPLSVKLDGDRSGAELPLSPLRNGMLSVSLDLGGA